MTQSEPVQMMTFNCAKHGAFECAPLFFFGKAKPLRRCPGCTDEYIAEQERKRDEQRKWREEESRRPVIRKPNETIPFRYHNATLQNYEAATEKQAIVAKRVAWFVETFHERRGAGTSLLMVGNPGTGKTHLACAVIDALEKSYAVRYSTVADFSAAVRECYKDGAKHTEKQVMQRYATPDLLVLDEVGASSGSDHEKQIFFEVLNERYNAVLPTILISNLPQADITNYLGERVMDRLREGGGKMLRFDWESHRK